MALEEVVRFGRLAMRWASFVCDVTGHSHYGIAIHIAEKAVEIMSTTGTIASIQVASRELFKRVREHLNRLRGG